MLIAFDLVKAPAFAGWRNCNQFQSLSPRRIVPAPLRRWRVSEGALRRCWSMLSLFSYGEKRRFQIYSNTGNGVSAASMFEQDLGAWRNENAMLSTDNFQYGR
jgi:hypothetical protein